MTNGRQQPLGGILVDVVRVPVTGVTMVAAILVTLAGFTDHDVEPLTVVEPLFCREPWRLLTSALLHADPIHLLFNLYWIWELGRIVEDRFGVRRALYLFLVLAASSSAAEYAVFQGGIGLSGVAYGLFGFLWMRARTDDSLRNTVGKRTALLFGGWFVLCVVLTAAGVWHIANVGGSRGLRASSCSGFRIGRR